VATNIYVGNLSYDTTEDTLRTLFAEYGEVEAVRVITDRYTGRSKGFGFVEIATEEAAQEAIGALNGKSVMAVRSGWTRPSRGLIATAHAGNRKRMRRL
jgi:RNA recognition motif-containing protein